MNKELLYKKAFMKAMNCKIDDFKAQRWANEMNNTSMLAEYKGRMYKIDTFNDIKSSIIEDLNFPEGRYIPASAISYALEDDEVHRTSEFYFKLLEIINKNEEEKNNLSLILAIHNTTNDNFWYLLESLGGQELYSNAITALCKVFDEDRLISGIVSYTIENGDKQLCMFTNGIFKTVLLNSNMPSEEHFYIYDVDYNFDDDKNFS
ncbi:hypothetical protein [Aquimarina sp. MMG016]|uniref:hypothetical protein n=1 Tax=Aquimarina sp. MMG016 TaxID=2822690 RepID=UPI001B39D0EE|nr:hypothetical protein [Aquimarina sp. MMG016]MBQ4818895.1 hypothetical protein [Aquimarina sp. MMG016]